MSNKLPPNVNSDDIAIVGFNDDLPETDEKDEYKEEMSRAAVGRLFSSEDSAPDASGSAFISGYDRAPEALEKPRPKPRVSPASLETRDWSKPANPNLRLVTNSEDTPPPPRPPQRQAQRPVREPEEAIPESADRPRPRRESSTTKMLQGDPNEIDYVEAGLRDGRNLRDRDRRRGSGGNPDPKPAVRVNVASERPMQDHEAEPQAEEDFSGFRQRFNPGELVSSPRNPNRPVRQGQNRDVRKDRMRVQSRDLEAISPFRWIVTAGALVILALFIFMMFRMSTLSGYRTLAEEYRGTLAEERARIVSVEQERNEYRAQVLDNERLINELRAGNDPNPPSAGPGQIPGTGSDTTPQQTPQPTLLPAEHTVVRGDNLHAIARRFYGNSDPETLQHIQAINGISNPNHIFVGQVLILTPMSD